MDGVEPTVMRGVYHDSLDCRVVKSCFADVVFKKGYSVTGTVKSFLSLLPFD